MDGRIFHLRSLLHERLDHHWTVDEMAAVCELSPAHFHKLFKLHEGISPMAYLTDLRLEKARELIETTYHQMKQIRRQIGMPSDSHFTRDFKKKFGLTPTEYRKQYWEIEQSVPPDGKE